MGKPQGDVLEEAVCKWCAEPIVPPTNEMPYWSEKIKFLGWHCMSQAGPGKHEPMPSRLQAYAAEAAKTPITREMILAAPDIQSLRMLALSVFDERTELLRLSGWNQHEPEAE